MVWSTMFVAVWLSTGLLYSDSAFNSCKLLYVLLNFSMHALESVSWKECANMSTLVPTSLHLTNPDLIWYSQLCVWFLHPKHRNCQLCIPLRLLGMEGSWCVRFIIKKIIFPRFAIRFWIWPAILASCSINEHPPPAGNKQADTHYCFLVALLTFWRLLTS